MTIEALRDTFTVRKRAGALEPFDRQKLGQSVRRAVADLPVTDAQTDELIGRICRGLIQEGFGQTLMSQRIGEVVLEELALLPTEGEMASIRYALYFYDQVDGPPASATEFARWFAAGHADVGVQPQSDGGRLVIKRGRRAVEPYDRSKLARSIHLALRGRQPESVLQPVVDQVCTEVEASLADQGIVTSGQVGAAVAARLRKIDLLAYLRYATIFKRLDSVSHFALEASVALEAGTPSRGGNLP